MDPQKDDRSLPEKRPVSLRKVEANLGNALKSTGPKTATGKEYSRSNAVRLGLFTRASLSHRVRRKLDKLEQSYTLHKSVDALKKYVEEIEGFCEAEIDAGRVADTPLFWARIYSYTLLSVKAKSTSLIGNRMFTLRRTGENRPGEELRFQTLQHELLLLVSEIERKLADALKDAEPAQAIDPVGKKPNVDRESLVQQLLRDKGWSINDWAVQSEVDFHTADSYLKGRSKPYKSTRKKLAGSLGINVEDLPT